MAQAPDRVPQVRDVVVNGVSDLMSNSYSGDVDIEEFFTRFKQWLLLHAERFHNDATRVVRIKYVLSGTALQLYNDLPVGGMPATLNNLQHDLFAKFRIAKTRQEWKKELDKCKYVPGTTSFTDDE